MRLFFDAVRRYEFEAVVALLVGMAVLGLVLAGKIDLGVRPSAKVFTAHPDVSLPTGGVQ